MQRGHVRFSLVSHEQCTRYPYQIIIPQPARHIPLPDREDHPLCGRGSARVGSALLPLDEATCG